MRYIPIFIRQLPAQIAREYDRFRRMKNIRSVTFHEDNRVPAVTVELSYYFNGKQVEAEDEWEWTKATNDPKFHNWVKVRSEEWDPEAERDEDQYEELEPVAAEPEFGAGISR